MRGKYYGLFYMSFPSSISWITIIFEYGKERKKIYNETKVYLIYCLIVNIITKLAIVIIFNDHRALLESTKEPGMFIKYTLFATLFSIIISIMHIFLKRIFKLEFEVKRNEKKQGIKNHI